MDSKFQSGLTRSDTERRIFQNLVARLTKRYEISEEQFALTPEFAGGHGLHADCALWLSPEARRRGETPWMIFEFKRTRFASVSMQSVMLRTARLAMELNVGRFGIATLTPDAVQYYALTRITGPKPLWKISAASDEFPRWEGLRDRDVSVEQGRDDREETQRDKFLFLLANAYDNIRYQERFSPYAALDELCKLLLIRAWWRRNYRTDMTETDFPQEMDTPPAKNVRLQELYHEALKCFPGQMEGADFVRSYPSTMRLALMALPPTVFPPEPEIAFSDFIDNNFQNIALDDRTTPEALTDFALWFLSPQPGETVCDPACGTGSFLYHAKRSLKQCGGDETDERPDIALLGVDADLQAVRIARMRFAFCPKQPDIFCGDGLPETDRLSRECCDVVFVHPPFSADLKKTYDGLTLSRHTARSEILFLERALNLLKEGGRMGILLPERVIVGQESIDKKARALAESQAELELVCRLNSANFGYLFLLFLRKRAKPPATNPIPIAIFKNDVKSVDNLPFSALEKAFERYRKGERAFPVTEGEVIVYALDLPVSRIWFALPPIRDAKYPHLPLAELLAKVEDKTPKEDRKMYRFLTVRDGKTVVAENPLRGASLPKKSYRVARSGQIAVLRAGKNTGAAGVVPEEGNSDIPPEQRTAGCLEGENVRLLEVTDRSRVTPEYIAEVLNLDAFRENAHYVMKANTGRLKISAFLQQMIPLPPMETQEKFLEIMRNARREAETLRKKADDMENEARKSAAELLQISPPQDGE